MSEFAKHLQNALNGTNDSVSRDELKEMLSGYLHTPAKPVYDPEAEALGEAIQEKLSGRDSLKDELLGRMHAAGMDVRNWTPPAVDPLTAMDNRLGESIKRERVKHEAMLAEYRASVDPEAQRLNDLADELQREGEAQNTQEIRGPVDLGWSPAGPGALNHDFREHNHTYNNIADIY
ncbi:hypothetical protein HGA13_19475 [Nocardia speluncae]|uniref:Uncharacterized protein n=1 Tax=Nocardia speluncae TaxID=419477 RepID=A0A846XKY0_9NOCA|nr:hypothetical protein [Nocardia speluncae]NKY35233.1 hypothetical protein [Nocardia speluncae]